MIKSKENTYGRLVNFRPEDNRDIEYTFLFLFETGEVVSIVTVTEGML